MITIFTNEYSQSVNSVIRFIGNRDQIQRVNAEDTVIGISLKLNENGFLIKLKSNSYNLIEVKDYPDISSVWFFHSNIRYAFMRDEPYIREEWKKMIYSTLKIFNKLNILGPLNEDFNFKIYNLFVAKKVGLNIPKTIISDNISEIKNIIQKDKFITKAISNVYREKYGDLFFVGPGTILLDEALLNNGHCHCFPSLIQEYIPKKIEVRSLFLNGIFYSMAIFSQLHEHTQVDFRTKDKNSLTRHVPFELPRKVKKKLKKLMRKLKLNFGSIDLIVTPENKYVFLEVNPEGQFEWVSLHCNYNIEGLIAKYLLKNKKLSNLE